MKHLICILLFGISFANFSQTRTSTTSGDWDDPNVWNPVGVPQDGEEIFIVSGHTIEIDGTPDITLHNVQITIDGTLDIDNDGLNIGNLNLTGDSGLLISPTGAITEGIGSLGEIFGAISLDGIVLWTACSNPICVGLANDALDPDPEVNGPQTGGTSGLLLPAIDNPLPVDLVSFYANLNRNSITLNWQTASELNNDHFEVERSSDGINFDKLGHIAGNGTTTDPLDYQFIDRVPMNGVNYYRLRQVDFDGAFEYSQIAYVHFAPAKNMNVINIYPNPAKEKIQIRGSDQMIFTRLTLININGKEVAPLIVGQNNEILLPNVNPGPYVLSYTTLDGNYGFKRLLIH